MRKWVAMYMKEVGLKQWVFMNLLYYGVLMGVVAIIAFVGVSKGFNSTVSSFVYVSMIVGFVVAGIAKSFACREGVSDEYVATLKARGDAMKSEVYNLALWVVFVVTFCLKWEYASVGCLTIFCLLMGDFLKFGSMYVAIRANEC